ncbi:Nif3-like dinuclear metal center hexameric protein [Rubrobacter aplysinae]|uniref:Nif3-like dinuclear metal center hexameric protein n=1 Tax=Rubrobacter aplysinae TaxID=909625 RepID=UPI00064BE048|nr:Nif3-like dinuclear metal center hexameric protein [Rubrobacter aplysinae]
MSTATTTVRDVARAVERVAPPSLAESWDNCGLQVGDPDAGVSRALVALTPLEEVFEEAEQRGADFLLFHHPLIFGGLHSVDTGRYPGGLISRAIKSGVAVYAAHTSYDSAPDGVSVALARTLGLEGPLDVISARGGLRKLVVFVPEEALGSVSEALDRGGAGVIGDYTRCTFRTPGTGTFLPGEASEPYSGERGRLQHESEIRLETVVAAHDAPRALKLARKAHPYEEMAYDLYPVDGRPEGCGLGRVGELPEPLSPRELTERVSASLGFEARLVADPGVREIRRVAVLGGSGGSFLGEVAASGADAYVTGDLSYHHALDAEHLGLAAIDAGHGPSEFPALAPLAERLGEMVDVPVEVSRVRR